MTELDDIISAVDETQRELLGWLRRFREELQGGGLQSELKAHKMLRRHAGHLANIGLSMKPLADRLRALAEASAGEADASPPKKLKLEKCPGCGAPCELTAEYRTAGNTVLVAVKEGSARLLTYVGGPMYRVECGKCETHLVSAAIMGLPAGTAVAIMTGPRVSIATFGRNVYQPVEIGDAAVHRDAE
jgi:hypothetical protein